jgi:hypothetical protein
MLLAGNSSLNIGRVGNNIIASDSSQDSAGVVFLINTPIPQYGTIFGFSAYLRSATPLTIQIWRPQYSVNASTTDTNSFILVDELDFYPNSSMTPGPQDVCILNFQCGVQ